MAGSLARGHTQLKMIKHKWTLALVLYALATSAAFAAPLDALPGAWEGVALPPPPPAPRLPPLVGRSAPARDGILYQTADRVALLSLLFARRFADLDRCMEAYQAAFENDVRKENWPQDATDTFDTADPHLTPLLDEWVRTSPDSFGAYGARGAHLEALAWKRRGKRLGHETSRAQFQSFDDLRARSAADFKKALALRPRFVAALQNLIGLSPDRAADAKRYLNDALRICPECFRVRRAYPFVLFPQWSGSLEQMEAFGREAAAAFPSNPKLKILPGFGNWLRCGDQIDEDPKTALATCEKATALGDYWEFLCNRALAKAALGRDADALTDMDRAIEQRPHMALLLGTRSDILFRMDQHERAARDYLLAVRLDPVTFDLRLRESAARGALSGAQRLLANRVAEAVLLLGLAHQLNPKDGQVRADPATEARAAIRACEDKPEEYERLAFALSKAHLVDGLVDLWTTYIARHPDDARGYSKRSFAYMQKGEGKLAQADYAKAQELEATAKPGGRR